MELKEKKNEFFFSVHQHIFNFDVWELEQLVGVHVDFVEIIFFFCFFVNILIIIYFYIQ